MGIVVRYRRVRGMLCTLRTQQCRQLGSPVTLAAAKSHWPPILGDWVLFVTSGGHGIQENRKAILEVAGG